MNIFTKCVYARTYTLIIGTHIYSYYCEMCEQVISVCTFAHVYL